MNTAIKIEELAMFALAIFLFYFQLDYAGWLFWALFLVPDLSMIGYLINTKAGAVTYNFVHHKALAIVLYCTGMYFHNDEIILAGLLLFGHSSMDRVLGYGLKYSDNFKHTHLGWMK